MLDFVGVLDTTVWIHDVVLIIKSFVFLKYNLSHNNSLVLILLFSIANILLFNIVTILPFKQIYKEMVN